MAADNGDAATKSVRETSMLMLPSITGWTLAAAMALALQAGSSVAGEGPREDGDAKQMEVAPTRTGKERLGGKASDEQRVDNCKVPPNRRGDTPRPNRCGEDASTGSTR
jgi:hypothetical protein